MGSGLVLVFPSELESESPLALGLGSESLSVSELRLELVSVLASQSALEWQSGLALVSVLP